MLEYDHICVMNGYEIQIQNYEIIIIIIILILHSSSVQSYATVYNLVENFPHH